MLKNITIKGYLDESSKEVMYCKLSNYFVGEEFNYAVVVLKFACNNDRNKIGIIPKVHNVVPFITKELATLYLKELSEQNKLIMLCPVKYGTVFPCREEMKQIIDNI